MDRSFSFASICTFFSSARERAYPHVAAGAGRQGSYPGALHARLDDTLAPAFVNPFNARELFIVHEDHV